MKDYIVDNRELIGQREYIKLSIQTAENIRDISKLQCDIGSIEKQMSDMTDESFMTDIDIMCEEHEKAMTKNENQSHNQCECEDIGDWFSFIAGNPYNGRITCWRMGGVVILYTQ